MKIRHQNGEWWKFADNGEGINRVKIIDIDDRPLTDEILKELGFEKYEKSANYKDLCLGSFFLEVKEIYDKNDDEFDEETYLNNENWINWTLAVTVCQYGREVDECYTYWKTVGSVRMLIEALKGDE